MAFAEAAEVLSDRFAVGRRQAYRYLQEAYQASSPLDTPEPKDVFTVKLPVTLIEQLRSHPRPAGQSLSNFVRQALERALRIREERLTLEEKQQIVRLLILIEEIIVSGPTVTVHHSIPIPKKKS